MESEVLRSVKSTEVYGTSTESEVYGVQSILSEF